MPYTIINQVRYYYEESGSGTPLVLLHGFTGSTENWAYHQAVFSRQYRMIAIDLLGHGRTDSPKDPARYSMENYVRDLIDLFQDILSEPVNLLGYSMGGRLGLYLALTRSAWVKTLILESASPGLQTEAERRERVERDKQLSQTIEREGIETFVRNWEQIPLFASQSQLTTSVQVELRRQRMKNNALGLANSLRGMGTGAQPSLWDRLRYLGMPVLLMAGAMDQKFVNLSGRTADLIPDARLEIIPDAGHTIHLEQPETFQKLVLHFLSSKQQLHEERSKYTAKNILK